ncbi:MAG: hypothetical protein WCD16_12690 [Paracoccaceae bacterium]
MQVVYHLGAHATDEGRLLKCLLKNADTLKAEGISLPGPSNYRPLLRDAVSSLNGKPATAEAQQTLLDAVLDEDRPPGRVIFSNPAFICAPAKVLDEGVLYARAGQTTHAMAQLFPQAECEFHIAIRNPATFIPAVFATCRNTSFEAFTGGIDPRRLRWSDVVARIQKANPDAMLTVWCNEDTPLIWPEVLSELSGHDPKTELDGIYDFHASIMSEAGMKRMRDYLQSHPPVNEIQRRRVVAAFLDKFAIPDEIEMELDLPGWTEALVEEVTELYEEDMFEIERMPGINFVTP